MNRNIIHVGTTVLLVLVGIGLAIVAAITGFGAVASFSEALHRCPGRVCNDFVRTGVLSGIIFLAAVAALRLMLERSKSHSDLK